MTPSIRLIRTNDAALIMVLMSVLAGNDGSLAHIRFSMGAKGHKPALICPKG